MIYTLEEAKKITTGGTYLGFPTIFEPKFLMYKAFENKGSGSWIVTIKPSTLFQTISELKFVVCRESF